MRGILSATPLDLVDLLLDLQRFEVVEFGLVRLELGVKLVLAGFLSLVTFEKNHASTLITGG